MLTRRGLITGLVSLVAAPAIVRVTSIMPVRRVQLAEFYDYPTNFNCRCTIRYYNELYAQMKLWHKEIVLQLEEGSHEH